MINPAMQLPVLEPARQAGSGILISVAICTHNRAAFLEKAIRSVLPQLTPDTELLVIDNASTDDTRQVCERLTKQAGAFAYFLEPQLGISAGRNLAVQKALGKYVLFFDDDQLAEAGWLEAFLKFLKNSPSDRIGAAGGGVFPYYDSPPPKWITPEHGRFDLGNQPLLRPRGELCGGNCAFNRAAVLGAGMYDERLGYKGSQKIPREESELQDRLIKAGWECWWLPGAAIRHFVPAQRLTMKAMAKSAFNAGQAAAIDGLKLATSTRQRFFLRVGRLFIAPFHIIINLLQAFFLFALGKQKQAVGAVCRIYRAAGWAWQVLRPLA